MIMSVPHWPIPLCGRDLLLVLIHSGYVYMHKFWFNQTESIPNDESECSVYMNAK